MKAQRLEQKLPPVKEDHIHFFVVVAGEGKEAERQAMLGTEIWKRSYSSLVVVGSIWGQFPAGAGISRVGKLRFQSYSYSEGSKLAVSTVILLNKQERSSFFSFICNLFILIFRKKKTLLVYISVFIFHLKIFILFFPLHLSPLYPLPPPNTPKVIFLALPATSSHYRKGEEIKGHHPRAITVSQSLTK